MAGPLENEHDSDWPAPRHAAMVALRARSSRATSPARPPNEVVTVADATGAVAADEATRSNSDRTRGRGRRWHAWGPANGATRHRGPVARRRPRHPGAGGWIEAAAVHPLLPPETLVQATPP